MEKELKPFDKILVRNSNKGYWIPALYGFKSKDMKHHLTSAGWQDECIPYEGNEDYVGTNKDYVCRISPELKESEDEKVRKDLIDFLEELSKLGKNTNFDKWSKSDCAEWIAWVEKQGEQKPAIIIPKFRVGDEICWKGDIDNNDTIAEICDGYYLNPLGNRMDISYTDTNFELVKHETVNKKEWTINDAKNGDMLSYSADDGSVWLMIFQSEYKPYEGLLHYHALLTDELYINGTCLLDVSNLRLSKEEERKLLIKEIQKEGYVWDSYGLELKKIEQKTVEWSEEDKKMLAEIVKDLQVCKSKDISRATKDAYQNEIDWLKSLKDRVQPQPKFEWSDEDKKFIEGSIMYLRQYNSSESEVKRQGTQSCINWLEALRDGKLNDSSVIKHKVGDKVQFYSDGAVYKISKVENGKYIFADGGGDVSVYEELIPVKESKGTLTRDKVKCGDYLHHKDGTIIKVHDIDEFDHIHFFCYANDMSEDGGQIQDNCAFMAHYGIIQDCRFATKDEIDFLEKWVAHKKYIWVEDNVSPDDEVDD